MELSSLRVRNIRSYAEAEVRFTEGTTLLVGDVGSGKTSLLYAIEMALFGFAEVDPTFLVRHQAPFAEVTLALTDRVHTYELRRRFRRRTVRGRVVFQLESSGYSEDGATRAYTTTELRRRTIDLLGFPDNPNPRAHSDLWRWAVYIPQERMREVLGQEPTDRLETVRKALGLEQYRTAADNAQLVATELRQRAERLAAEAVGLAHFTDELDRWGAELESSTAQADAARTRAGPLTERAAALESEIRQLGEDRVRAEAARQEVESLRDRVRALRVSLQQLEERTGALQRERERVDTALHQDDGVEAASLEAEAALDPFRREVLDARAARDRSLADRSGADAVAKEIAALRTRLAQADEEIRRERADEAAQGRELTEAEGTGPVKEPPAPTPRSLAEITADLETLHHELDRVGAALARAELVARDIAGLLQEGICPRCRQPVRTADFDAHHREAEAALAEARDEEARTRSRVKQAEDERKARERYERARLTWERAEERRAALRVRLDDTRRRIATLEERRSVTTAELSAALERERRLAPAIARYESDQARLGHAEAALERGQAAWVELSRRRDQRRAAADQGRRIDEELVRLREESTARSQEAEEAERARSSREMLAEELDRHLVRLRAAQDERAVALLELDRVQRDLGSAAASERHARAQLERARDGVERRRRLEGSADDLRGLAQWLGHELREGLMALEQRLLVRAQADFERAFARYFHSLVDDPSLLARCDTAFTPAVEIQGEWTPAEALSGGERTALALAYRLALGHVVRAFGQLTLSTVILDEPTDGFSPEQVIRMGELLDELDLPQVLLVSHEGGLASVADRVIRVRKEGGTSSLLEEERPGVPGETSVPAPATEPAAATPRGRRRRRTVEEAAAEPAR